MKSVADTGEAVSDDYIFRTRSYDSGSSDDGDGGSEPQDDNLYLTIALGEETSDWPIAATGHLITEVNFTSPGNEIPLHIPDDTCCLNPERCCLHNINACCESDFTDYCSDCAQNYGFTLVSEVYDIGPSGSTFSPYAQLTLTYNESDFPAGIEEGDLFIGCCDGDTWEPLESIVDTAGNTVSAKVTHFSVFSIVAKSSPKPSAAEFLLSGLSISPEDVSPGERISISIQVENIGGGEGTHPVSLRIDDTLEETREITVAPGDTETVIFKVTRTEPGTYSVAIDEMTGSFTVKKAATPSGGSGMSPLIKNPTLFWIIIAIITFVLIFTAIKRHRKMLKITRKTTRP